MTAADHTLMECTCPACGHHVAARFFDGGDQPLATLAWPRSAEEAGAMPCLPLSFVRCLNCGHIYNAEFDYRHVPYSDKPNLMFNRGTEWQEHLAQTRALVNRSLPENPVVIEIGCGEGHFLRDLAKTTGKGRFIGFDPNASINTEDGLIEARNELFIASRDVARYRPDLIICRHLLEHLNNPLGFLQPLSIEISKAGLHTALFAEAPCVDRVFETGRIADFYYEHNSHFTTRSFTRMLELSTQAIDRVEHGYDREVIYALAWLGCTPQTLELEEDARRFHRATQTARDSIGTQLAALAAEGCRVAVWGGTGKAAAFINYYGLDAARFPLVVDSDYEKVGTFVPGSGQAIAARDCLLADPPDVVIIPTQWRARDIVAEMTAFGIAPARVLIEHRGRLVDFHRDAHPYRRGQATRESKPSVAVA
jgi:SAM-dependent methyltransferase